MNESSTHKFDLPGSLLLTAIVKLMRPLAKLMLHYRITYPQCAAALKAIFVATAEESFKTEGIAQTDSRISFLTGINRKEVKRLRATSGIETAINKPAGSRIFDRWLQTDSAMDGSNQPQPLPILGERSPARSFSAFVGAECRSDIRPKVVLDEWLRQGLVCIEDNVLLLNPSAITPKEGFDDKSSFFGENIQDHIQASSHNLMGLRPSFFDRSVHCEGLSDQSIAQLEAFARELGMDALTKMNTLASELQQSDSQQNTAKSRFKFGVFSFHRKETPSEIS